MARLQLPFSIAGILALLIVLSSALPFLNIFIMFPVAKAFLAHGQAKGYITRARWWDYLLLSVIVGIALFLVAQFTINLVLKRNIFIILFAGIIADALLWLAGFPLRILSATNSKTMLGITQFITGIGLFGIVWYIIGGDLGIILGTLSSFLVYIPWSYKIFGLNTITFAVIKILTEVFF